MDAQKRRIADVAYKGGFEAEVATSRRWTVTLTSPIECGSADGRPFQTRNILVDWRIGSGSTHGVPEAIAVPLRPGYERDRGCGYRELNAYASFHDVLCTSQGSSPMAALTQCVNSILGNENDENDELVAANVGYYFDLIPAPEVLRTALVICDENVIVEMDGAVYTVVRGATYEDSRSVDALLDDRKEARGNELGYPLREYAVKVRNESAFTWSDSGFGPDLVREPIPGGGTIPEREEDGRHSILAKPVNHGDMDRCARLCAVAPVPYEDCDEGERYDPER